MVHFVLAHLLVRPEEENRLNALTLDPIEERDEEIWKHLLFLGYLS